MSSIPYVKKNVNAKGVGKMQNAMVLNRDFKIVMSNKLIKGKQDMLTLWQHKIFRMLISQIKPTDKGLETYSCKITDLAAYLGLKPNSMYGDINELTDKLMQAFIKIKTGGNGKREDWIKINLISSCSCSNGILTIRLNDDVKPFVLRQKGFYTQYEIGSILNFKSVYAIRLYEVLLSDFKMSYYDSCRHKFIYSLEQLREYMGCEDKLLKFSQFKEKCVNKAICEINNSDSSEFSVTAKYYKNGRTVTSIGFIIVGKNEHFAPCDDYDNIIKNTYEWNDKWTEPDEPLPI